jgi:hypothetical protein
VYFAIYRNSKGLIEKGEKSKMKKTIVGITMAITVLLFQTVFAEENNKRAVLQIQTKDPMMAYRIASAPIYGPLAAYDYLASSPIKWREDIPEVKSKAIKYALLNTATIVGGIVLMATSYVEKEVVYSGYSSHYTTEGEFKPFQFTLGMTLALLGPAIENHFFGNYFAKWAVDSNKKLYKQFDYEPPPVSFNLGLEKKEIRLSCNTQF